MLLAVSLCFAFDAFFGQLRLDRGSWHGNDSAEYVLEILMG